MAHRAKDRRLAPLTGVRVVVVTLAFVTGMALFWLVDCVDYECYFLIQKLLPYEPSRWDTSDWGSRVRGGIPVLGGMLLGWSVSKVTVAIERRLRGWDEDT